MLVILITRQYKLTVPQFHPKRDPVWNIPFLWSLHFKTELLPSLSLPVQFTCLGRIFMICHSHPFWKCPYSIDKASCTFGYKRKTATEKWAQEEPAPRRWLTNLGQIRAPCNLHLLFGAFTRERFNMRELWTNACLKPTVAPREWDNNRAVGNIWSKLADLPIP